MEQTEIKIRTLFEILSTQTREFKTAQDLSQLHWLIHGLISQAIAFDAFYIGYHVEGVNALEVRFLVDEGRQHPEFIESLENSVAGVVIAKGESIFLNSQEEILQLLKPSNVKAFGSREKLPRSILASPILIPNGILGVMSLQSYESNRFSRLLADFIFAFCSQVGPWLGYFLSKEKAKGQGLQKAPRLVEEIGDSALSSLEENDQELYRQNDRLRSVIELARRICHEMNQPLTGISGYCALIREDLKESDPTFEDLDQIEKQAQRLEQLIYNFQNIAQLEDLEDLSVET